MFTATTNGDCFGLSRVISFNLSIVGTSEPQVPCFLNPVCSIDDSDAFAGRQVEQRNASMSLSDDKLLSVRNQVYIEDSSSGCSCGTIVNVELEGCLHLHSDRGGLATDLLASDVPAPFSNKL